MFHDHSIMYPNEPSLLGSCQQAPNTSTFRDSISSKTFTEDDYGECDVSLRSYHSSNSGIDETFGLSQQEANGLLYDRLHACGLSSRNLHIASNGKYTFVAGRDQHTIDINIRGDTKAVVISTVVHKGTHVLKNHLRSGTSYSLMTKMMKHNALLSRAGTGSKPDASHVNVYDGTFILFSSIGLSALSSTSQLQLVLDDFIFKAVQIRTDFANKQRLERGGTNHTLSKRGGAEAA